MNAIIEAIKGRRSIRKYLPNQIKDEEINLILEAAGYAPSGHNEQPWHFTVLQHKELIDSISAKTKAQMAKSSTDWICKMGQSERYNPFYNAPTIVIISGKENLNEDISYCPLADCSAAIENMLLAAHSIGVASCWIGFLSFIFDLQEEIAKLQLPDGYKPLFAVTLGYSAITKEINALDRKSDVISFIR